MKKNLTLLLLIFTFSLSAQNILISELADPDDDSSCRFVEIFCHGPLPCDMSGRSLARWTNASPTPTMSTLIPLDVLGVMQPNEIAVISNNSATNGTFLTCYGFNANITAGGGGPADSNGDDQIGIVENGVATIVDIFGVPGEDGTGTCHEFEDGRAERKSSVELSNPVWDEAEWNVWADSPVSGCTSHTNQTQDVSDMDPLSSILPVELVEFRIQKGLESNRLNWKTMSEVNNQYFEIQHSSDGKSFNPIGKVNGKGNSNEELEYNFIDQNPKSGLNYYRLKQVDFNGQFEFSYVIKVENLRNEVRIYPTKTNNLLTVELGKNEDAKLDLINNFGILMHSEDLSSSYSTINISQLPAGVYYVRIELASTIITEKILKF